MAQRGEVMRSLGFLLHENVTKDEVIKGRPWIDAWRECVGYWATRPQDYDDKGLDHALLDVDGGDQTINEAGPSIRPHPDSRAP